MIRPVFDRRFCCVPEPSICSCVHSRSMLLVLYYLLIPSHPVPLWAIPLIFSYFKQTWESLGPQVTSSVSFVSLSPPFPSVLPLQSRKLSLDLFPFSCVLLCAAPLPTARRPCPPSIPSPSAFARTLRRNPSFRKRSRSPRLSENSITPVTHVALLRGTSILAVTPMLQYKR